jgi:hypothetical protein
MRYTDPSGYNMHPGPNDGWYDDLWIRKAEQMRQRGGVGSGNHWSDTYRSRPGNFYLMSREAFDKRYGDGAYFAFIQIQNDEKYQASSSNFNNGAKILPTVYVIAGTGRLRDGIPDWWGAYPQGQGGSNYAWAGVLAFAGTAAVADGPIIPIGDVIGGAVILGYGTYVLADKMASEISRIAQKVNNTRGFVYELRVNQTGTYINVRGIPVQLNAGDVWKYGETTSLYRYSGPELDNMVPGGVHRIDIFPGNVAEIKIQEKIMIYGYYFQHGYLPPGNKIFR